MADDEQGDKTEAPTPRRLEEARAEGRIARSAEFTAAVSLLIAVVGLKLFGPSITSGLLDLTRDLGRPAPVRTDELERWAFETAGGAGRLVFPLMGLILLVTAAAAAAQAGVVLTWKKLQPDWSRIDPVAGTRRLVSAESLQRLAVVFLKMVIVGAVAWWGAGDALNLLLSGGFHEPGPALAAAADAVYRLALHIGIALVVLGLVDYFLQRWKLLRTLRMTKQEVRDELKHMEGDPSLKQRRRQIQMKLAMQRLAHEVPKAHVIVTNPTEYAVALRYDASEMAAPRVVAKGVDLLALRIRHLAQEHGVPIVQRPPLARALFAACEVGDEVPALYYKAVAELLAYVYRLSGRAAVKAD